MLTQEEYKQIELDILTLQKQINEKQFQLAQDRVDQQIAQTNNRLTQLRANSPTI
jgi:hypothetical protein